MINFQLFMASTNLYSFCRPLGFLSLLALLAASSLFFTPSHAESPRSTETPLAPLPGMAPEAPPDLQRWRAWVLAGHERQRCPFLYNDPQRRYCAWPLRLRLDLEDTGGRFSTDWIFETAGWAFLPGDAMTWPRQVLADGRPQPLLQHLGHPALYLEAGRHRLEGAFSWADVPELLRLPPTNGVLELSLRGVPVSRPRLEKDGRLWLREGPLQAQEQLEQARDESLDITVVRLLRDDIPQQLTTRLLLEVSGPEREAVLGAFLPTDALPIAVHGKLSMRLEEDGRLRVQLRPGSWQLEIRSRQPGPVRRLALPDNEPPLPEVEHWAFHPRPGLRQVRLEGATQVDAGLTRLPPGWQRFPVYRVGAGSELRFVPLLQEEDPALASPPTSEIARLEMNRNLWLDFDGQGYTVLDDLYSKRPQVARLEVIPELRLGRAQLDGEPQYITRQPGSERWGLKLRGAPLRLLAESRYEGSSRHFPAVGWNQDLHKASVSLHLPPGWRLFTVSGPDWVQEREDWVRFWDVYKLFFVLFATIAVSWMFGFRWALIPLLTLGLCWNEFHGFQGTGWFWVLAGLGLLRALQKVDFPRLRRLVLTYSWVVWGLLLLFLLPFIVLQLRNGIYPQLEYLQALPSAEAEATLSKPAGEAPVLLYKGQPPSGRAPALSPTHSKLRLGTGPGRPNWNWRKVDMRWEAPVRQEQQFSLWLIPPPLNLFLCITRVFLVLWLLFLLLRELRRHRLPPPQPKSPPGQPVAGAALASLWLAGALALLAAAAPGTTARADTPSPELLKEYQRRLLAPPDCLPECAQVQKLWVSLQDETLELRMEVHAQEAVAIPLPGGHDSWLPARLSLDGQEGVARLEKGILLLRTPPGIHQVLATGPVLPESSLRLSLPLPPKILELSLGPGWEQEGSILEGDQTPTLRLQRTTRLEKRMKPSLPTTVTALAPGDYPVFLSVQRYILLGVAKWQVNTQVRLETPTRPGAGLKRIPLLPGETVLGNNVTVKDGAVWVDLGGPRREWQWESLLAERESLTLEAPEDSSRIERWALTDRSHMALEYAGLAPLLNEPAPFGADLYWRPWPGESVELRLDPLRSAPGPELTIESLQATLRAGADVSDLDLEIELRAARAGEEKLLLPPGMRVQDVRRNNETLPILQQDRELILKLLPGEQRIQIQARTTEGIRNVFHFPEIQLPVPAANVTWEFHPGTRWILLLGGPLLGPAVLFWPSLLVIFLLAFLLGRPVGGYRISPLRTPHWLLLGLGLTQGGLFPGLTILLWFFAMALRERYGQPLRMQAFNFVQCALVGLTLLFILAFLKVIENSLLGMPETQITGNGSTADVLRWFQDRSAETLPQPWVLSFPLWIYRILTLAWALWLAVFILRYAFVWGWSCFAKGGLWRSFPAVTPPEHPKPEHPETVPPEEK